MNDWQILKQVPRWSKLVEDIINYFDEDGQLVISSKSGLIWCDVCYGYHSPPPCRPPKREGKRNENPKGKSRLAR